MKKTMETVNIASPKWIVFIDRAFLYALIKTVRKRAYQKKQVRLC